ncbi:Nitrogen assimilation transcription factor nit-4 [Colletotrichum trifolii]|uniref:Nitrogen assimilation transcription factor nit-4 n=1 Tax=Colletotrichum trifolii TaxID=5466 RepID=A0A4R8QR08_COLTR|nr:Nitrogen assimilation transcription factor nit-4 [Colletotrichum trifolii]
MSNPVKLRPLLPLASAGPPAPVQAAPKRKRPQVSAACNGCRKRKVKCDGVRPICYACSVAKTPCVYPVPEGLSQREAQKQKLSHVSKAHESSRRVLELLRASGDGSSQDILEQLQLSEHLDETIQSIADASLLLPRYDNRRASLAEPEASPTRLDHPTSGPNARRLTGSSEGSPRLLVAGDEPESGPILPVSRWTTVSQDDKMLSNLINLFWTWEPTLSRLVDRDLFVSDVNTATPAGWTSRHPNFCSPFLVNALLAVSSLHATRKFPYPQSQGMASLSQSFARYAFELLEVEKHNDSITLMQGAAILWVIVRNEGSQASRSRASQLADLLKRKWSEFGLGIDGAKLFQSSDQNNHSDARLWHAASYITWGFYCFFAKVAMFFSPQLLVQRPLLMKTFEPDVSSLGSVSPGSTASFDDEDPLATQAAYQLQVFIAECSLCEIMDQFVSGFVRDGQNHLVLDSRHCTTLYNKLLCWKLALPDHLTTSHSVLPSVLLLQTTYDFVALKLLLAFTNQSGSEFDGHDAASLQVLHANSMMTNLWIYRGIYTLKHEYWAMEACSSAAIALLPRLKTEPALHDVIGRACWILDEMKRVSGRATELLRAIEEKGREHRLRIPPYGSQSSFRRSSGEGSPLIVVQGAKVFDGSRGGVLGPADGVKAVSFSNRIANVQQSLPPISSLVGLAGGGGGGGGGGMADNVYAFRAPL